MICQCKNSPPIKEKMTYDAKLPTENSPFRYTKKYVIDHVRTFQKSFP